MEIRLVRTDADHRDALREIDRLWGAPEGSPEGEKLDVLVTLVEVYETKRWPMNAPPPRDMLHFAITDMGRSQKELAKVVGSRSVASELLSGKRKVSLDVARKVSAAWNMPIQLLIAPYGPKDSDKAA